MKKKFSVLYSVSQKAFHIEELQETLHLNLKNAVNKIYINDYNLIGIFDSYDEASEFIVYVRELQENKH